MEKVTLRICNIKHDRGVLRLVIDEHDMLVFFSPETRKFSGIFDDGTRFTSSDKCYAKWFKQLNKFLGEIC